MLQHRPIVTRPESSSELVGAKFTFRPKIKSTWPLPIGNRLTDQRIAHYKKLGYYSNGFVESEFEKAEEKVKRDKMKNKQKVLKKVKHNLDMLLEEFL